jgi:hypothetical protein
MTQSKMAKELTPDYLVIGAGAMGMAFVDTLLSDTKEATVVLVDRYARPGGHWTIAYPFVRLHQPSAFYGVNSRPLGEDSVEKVGLNKGLAELATVDEVCAYYSTVLQQTFLPSGRVRYFPKHEYLGEGAFRSVITNKAFRVGERTKIVDATFMKVKVPAMSPPAYNVSEGVNLITPNDLPKILRPYGGYTVVGAGKTGIDAGLWLIANGVAPRQISWIMPRDSWFLERGSIQPGAPFAQMVASSMQNQAEATMKATSPDDLFRRLEACGELLRLDDQVWPSMYRCATISKAELEEIKKVSTVIRQGRVLRISKDKVTLENGTYTPMPDSLYIDCTADALAKLDPVPVFQGRHIALQAVRYCQQVFSAAFIAHVESTYSDDKFKNEFCRVVPHPSTPADYIVGRLEAFLNSTRWNAEPKTALWLKSARLDISNVLLASTAKGFTDLTQFTATVKANLDVLGSKLEHLINQLPEEEAARAKHELGKFRES